MPRLVGSLVILSGRSDLHSSQAYANRHKSQIAQFLGLLFHPGKGTLVRGKATFTPDLISNLWEERALMSFTKACPSL